MTINVYMQKGRGGWLATSIGLDGKLFTIYWGRNRKKALQRTRRSLQDHARWSGGRNCIQRVVEGKP